jgi:hypothetical protein
VEFGDDKAVTNVIDCPSIVYGFGHDTKMASEKCSKKFKKTIDFESQF